MAFVKHYDVPPAAGPACIHLRSKGMIVSGRLKDPDHPDEVESGACWCNITQHVLGPDRSAVDRPACVPGRECYREY